MEVCIGRDSETAFSPKGSEFSAESHNLIYAAGRSLTIGWDTDFR